MFGRNTVYFALGSTIAIRVNWGRNVLGQISKTPTCYLTMFPLNIAM